MVNWPEIGRSIGVDFLKVLGAWYAELSRAPREDSKSFCPSEPVVHRAWCDEELQRCFKQLGRIWETERELVVVQRNLDLCEQRFAYWSFSIGVLFGILLAFLGFRALKFFHTPVLVSPGKPVEIVVEKTRPVLEKELTASDSSENEEVVNARLRARSLSGRPSATSLAGSFCARMVIFAQSSLLIVT